METIHYTDPRFELLMQTLVVMVFLIASIQAIRGKDSMFSWSGLLVVLADPRFFGGGGINYSIIMLFLWGGATWVYATHGNIKLNYLTYIIDNKLLALYAAFLYILFISLINLSESAITRYLLIIGPYIVLLPLAVKMSVMPEMGIRNAKRVLKGMQIGFVIYVGLVHTFAPGEVTGALGDVTVSATIVGIYCSYGLILSLFLLLLDRGWLPNFINLMVILFFLVSLLLTLSRGPLIAVVTTFFVYFSLLFKKHSRQIGISATFIVYFVVSMATVYLLFNLPSVFAKRNVFFQEDVITLFINQFKDSRYNYILDVLDFDSISFSMLLFGHGLGESEAIARMYGLYRVESFWFESAYDVGLIGTALLFVGYLLNVIKISPNKSQGSQAFFQSLYFVIFLFTLFLSISSFGWFLQGHTGFIYALLLYIGCVGYVSSERNHPFATIHCKQANSILRSQ